VHHIIFDGASIDVLLQELAQLYPAALAGEPEPLPALPMQAADVARAERTRLDDARRACLLEACGKLLGDELPVLTLPVDRARPPVQRFRGATLKRALAPATQLALEGRVPGRAGHSLHVRRRRVRDLAVPPREPGGGRDRQPVRAARRQGREGPARLLRQHRGDAPGGGTRHRLPRAAARERAPGASRPWHAASCPSPTWWPASTARATHQRPPVFRPCWPCRAGVRPRSSGRTCASPTSASWPSTMARFDVSLVLDFCPTAPSCRSSTARTCSTRPPPKHVRAPVRAVRLGAGAARRGGRPPRALLPATSARPSRPGRGRQWRACPTPAVHALFARAGGGDAGTGRGRARRHGDFLPRPRRTGAGARGFLHAQGVGGGDLVGLCLPRSPEFLVAVLAVWKAGAAYVPLDPEQPAARHAWIAQDAGCATC
jgi:hypothetical protein